MIWYNVDMRSYESADKDQAAPVTFIRYRPEITPYDEVVSNRTAKNQRARFALIFAVTLAVVYAGGYMLLVRPNVEPKIEDGPGRDMSGIVEASQPVAPPEASMAMAALTDPSPAKKAAASCTAEEDALPAKPVIIRVNQAQDRPFGKSGPEKGLKIKPAGNLIDNESASARESAEASEKRTSPAVVAKEAPVMAKEAPKEVIVEPKNAGAAVIRDPLGAER